MCLCRLASEPSSPCLIAYSSLQPVDLLPTHPPAELRPTRFSFPFPVYEICKFNSHPITTGEPVQCQQLLLQPIFACNPCQLNKRNDIYRQENYGLMKQVWCVAPSVLLSLYAILYRFRVPPFIPTSTRHHLHRRDHHPLLFVWEINPLVLEELRASCASCDSHTCKATIN